MPTGVFKSNTLGEPEEVEQEHIDYWCGLCQFPLGAGGTKCKEKWQIQLCWQSTDAEGGK